MPYFDITDVFNGLNKEEDMSGVINELIRKSPRRVFKHLGVENITVNGSPIYDNLILARKYLLENFSTQDLVIIKSHIEHLVTEEINNLDDLAYIFYQYGCELHDINEKITNNDNTIGTFIEPLNKILIMRRSYND